MICRAFRTRLSQFFTAIILLQNVSAGQVGLDVRSAEELLSDAVLILDELSVDYCARYSGESALVKRDGSERLNSIRGHSVVTREPEYTEFHSVAITQIHPPVGSQERWYEALRFKDSSRSVFSSRRDLGLSKEALKAKGLSPYQRLEAETEKASGKWPWTEADPFGFCVSTGSGMLNGRLSELSAFMRIYPNLKFVNSEVEKNGDVTGKWRFQNGTTTSEFKYRFGKQVNYLPVLVQLRVEGDSVFSKIENPGTTLIEWSAFGKTFLPKRHKVTYTSSSGDETEIDLSWEWLPAEFWQKHRIGFANELQKDSESNFRGMIDQLFDQYNSADKKSRVER